MYGPLARCYAATWLCPDDCAGLAGLLRMRLHAYNLCGLASSTCLKSHCMSFTVSIHWP